MTTKTLIDAALAPLCLTGSVALLRYLWLRRNAGVLQKQPILKPVMLIASVLCLLAASRYAGSAAAPDYSATTAYWAADHIAGAIKILLATVLVLHVRRSPVLVGTRLGCWVEQRLIGWFVRPVVVNRWVLWFVAAAGLSFGSGLMGWIFPHYAVATLRQSIQAKDETIRQQGRSIEFLREKNRFARPDTTKQ